MEKKDSFLKYLTGYDYKNEKFTGAKPPDFGNCRGAGTDCWPIGRFDSVYDNAKLLYEIEQREKLLKESNFTAVCDELENLKKMTVTGEITVDEFEKIKNESLNNSDTHAYFLLRNIGNLKHLLDVDCITREDFDKMKKELFKK